MTTLAEIRRKYPQYSDMSDEQLATSIHKRFYKDIPIQDFSQRIGLAHQREQMTHRQSGPGMPAGPIVDRAGVLPLGRDEYGRTRLAAPGMVQEVADSARRLIDRPVTLDNIDSPLMVGDAANVAGSLTLGAGAIPKQGAELGMGIRAYHGSPHDFDKFRLADDTIGTGEGAQAYGHGLYFAENEGVAKAYRENLMGRGAVMAGDLDALPDKWQTEAFKALSAPNGPIRADAISRIRERMPEEYRSIFDEAVAKRGRMYEVDINADPEDFLDWDKPYSQQTAKVKEAVKSAFVERGLPIDESGVPTYLARDPTGEAIRATLESMNKSDIVPKMLAPRGIPGIRYLDQGSRSGGEGTSNYVLFRDDIIDIVKKYGWAGLTPFGYGLLQPENSGVEN